MNELYKVRWSSRFKKDYKRADWLLIYTIQNDVLVLELTRTGSHADLFE